MLLPNIRSRLRSEEMELFEECVLNTWNFENVPGYITIANPGDLDPLSIIDPDYSYFALAAPSWDLQALFRDFKEDDPFPLIFFTRRIELPFWSEKFSPESGKHIFGCRFCNGSKFVSYYVFDQFCMEMDLETRKFKFFSAQYGFLKHPPMAAMPCFHCGDYETRYDRQYSWEEKLRKNKERFHKTTIQEYLESMLKKADSEKPENEFPEEEFENDNFPF